MSLSRLIFSGFSRMHMRPITTFGGICDSFCIVRPSPLSLTDGRSFRIVFNIWVVGQFEIGFLEVPV
jgi:hypothetical protein